MLPPRAPHSRKPGSCRERRTGPPAEPIPPAPPPRSSHPAFTTTAVPVPRDLRRNGHATSSRAPLHRTTDSPAHEQRRKHPGPHVHAIGHRRRTETRRTRRPPVSRGHIGRHGGLPVRAESDRGSRRDPSRGVAQPACGTVGVGARRWTQASTRATAPCASRTCGGDGGVMFI